MHGETLTQARRFGARMADWGSNLVLIMLLAGVIAIVAAPHVLGWRYGVLRSGSMSPAMPAGAAIVVAPAAAGSVHAGDVITFRSATNRALLTTHRVFAVTEDADGNLAFQTKGDANAQPDAGLVTADRLVGRVVFSVPELGKLAGQLHTKTAFLLLMVLPTALIIAMELRELAGGLTDLRRERKQSKAGGGVGSSA